MSEWFSYSPEDFLLFSSRVYFRLLELHNAEVWPVHIAVMAAGVALIVLALRPVVGTSRIVGVILGAVWLWVAWSFLWQRYATINWAVAYVAPVFVVQALALLWAGWRDRLVPVIGRGPVGVGALALLAGAVIGYPALAYVFGRSLAGAEVFGIVPDPTALATAAVIALAPRAPKALIAVPIAWLLFSSGVLHLLAALEWFIPATGALLAMALVAIRQRASVNSSD